MKKEKSIQVNIEKLKDLSKYLSNDPDTPFNVVEYARPAITSAISALEAMRDAGDMLPEIEVDNLLRKLCSTRHTLSLIPEIRDRIRDLCQPIVNKLLKENKELRNRLDNWIYKLAYYTEDEVATPKGVKKFVGKALDDKVKEIDDLREQLHKEKLITGTGTSEQIFKREELDNGR